MILPIFLPFVACGNRCIYCEQQSITGLSLKNDSLDLFIDEQVKAWLAHTDLKRIDEVAYYGGNFGAIDTALRKKLYDKAHSLGISSIRYSTRPDTIKDELLKEAEIEGVSLIELGVQSLNNEVLKKNGRPYNRQRVFEAIRDILEVTDCGVQMMSGMYMQEGTSLIDDSLRLALFSKKENLKKQIKCARIYPTIVFKRTILADLYEKGRYVSPTLKETILQVGGAYISFLANGIDVIRIGLPQEARSEDMIAGIKHPAMGDIIKTFLLLLYFSLERGSGKVYSSKYAGYKSICKQTFPELFDSNKNTNPIDNLNLYEIAKIVSEHYLEDSFRFIKGQAALYAEGLSSKADNR